MHIIDYLTGLEKTNKQGREKIMKVKSENKRKYSVENQEIKSKDKNKQF